MSPNTGDGIRHEMCKEQKKKLKLILSEKMLVSMSGAEYRIVERVFVWASTRPSVHESKRIIQSQHTIDHQSVLRSQMDKSQIEMKYQTRSLS